MSFHAKIKGSFWQEFQSLLTTVWPEMPTQKDALVHSELLYCSVKIYSSDGNTQTETKTESIPQTSSESTPAATNHNVETKYPFWIWLMSGGSGRRDMLLPSRSRPCPWCLQPLILTADANSLKKRPYQTFAFKQIDKGHFEKLPPHDYSVRWHVPCVPALLTT